MADLLQIIANMQENPIDAQNRYLQSDIAIRNERLNSVKRALEAQKLGYKTQIFNEIFGADSEEGKRLGLLGKLDVVNERTTEARQGIQMQRDIEDEKTVALAMQARTAIENGRYDLLPEIVAPAVAAAKNAGDALGAGMLAKLASAGPEGKEMMLAFLNNVLNLSEKGRAALEQQAKNELAPINRENVAAQTRQMDASTGRIGEETEGLRYQNTPEQRALQSAKTQAEIGQTNAQADALRAKAAEKPRMNPVDEGELKDAISMRKSAVPAAMAARELINDLYSFPGELNAGTFAMLKRRVVDPVTGGNWETWVRTKLENIKFDNIKDRLASLKGNLSDKDLAFINRTQPDIDAGPEVLIPYLMNAERMHAKIAMLSEAREYWLYNNNGVGDIRAYHTYMDGIKNQFESRWPKKSDRELYQEYRDRHRTKGTESGPGRRGGGRIAQ